ncbi:MAG TPA: hypothetical protein VE136_16530 [Anaerolineales bacterium]|jgi:hypothetical protein|nr:hypothetical protein [Anaerolineales bacterium]
MNLSPEVLKKIVTRVANTRPDEISCAECFDELDEFAELVLSGKSVDEARPLVQDHLKRCKDCREEFEALLDSLTALQ